MAKQSGNETRGGNIPALERASGRTWPEWIEYFESHGAKTLGHTAIAELAVAFMPTTLKNPHWWAQAATIAYEQHAGLRVPGQLSTGKFRVSASRTLAVDRDSALELWLAAHGSAADHLDLTVSNGRSSRTAKRSFWRFALEGAGKVEIAAEERQPGKTILTVSHEDLPSGDTIEQWRAYWKAQLAAL